VKKFKLHTAIHQPRQHFFSGGERAIFIFLLKWKKAVDKEVLDKFTKIYDALRNQDVKLQLYWTLGHFNFVCIMEAPSEKDAIKLMPPFADVADVEALTAIPRDEAVKLV
jgi:uncharacterized protein with GYD domain